MHLVFDIFQGIGIAAAVGIRPFLPALVVGALAAGDIQIDFAHSSYSFLQSALFLLVMVIGVVLLGLTERRAFREALSDRLLVYTLTGVSLVVGALLFAGSLARGHYAAWPGLIGGVICAGVGILATQPLLGRVRARLDAEAAGALPFVTEGAAVVSAALSVLLPPVGVIVLALLLWLLIAGRGRSEQKYAGLRILR
ncbi:MAG TPA: DUF4126 family protein [Solirubrobacteraceae bacterium]|nr:DUF4126 family protein [Solirubrobacteraceae bacterium]